ncbi:hypothetical protein GCM10023094_24080 [Rhodococcus olei]|uniref:CHAD domain-containing protein n=1 Tax=Rhodococcus olei TaxID=2161675 RepID=A0ABP8P0C0_9NOCA
MGRRRREADTEAVLRSVRGYRDRLTGLTDAVRADEPDAVHQMRVAARRLRSVLGTYTSIFPKAEAAPVRSELRWLGTVLGRARDQEVLAARFAEELDAQPPDLVRGPVRYRLVTAHREEYRAAHTNAVMVLADPRFHDLVTALNALCSRPVKDRKVARSTRRAHRRVLRAARAAGLRGGGGEPGPPEALHTLRKRAKALRYAGEALAPSRPRASKVARAAEDLQTVLGEYQDAVVARGQVLVAADRARAAGEDTFTYGVIAAVEESVQERATGAARGALRTVRAREL